MPRLVDLADRAAGANEPIAENAGALLAELHQREHTVPEFWSNPEAVRGPAAASLASEYKRRFDACVPRSAYRTQVSWYIERLKKHRDSYEKLQASSGVPWFFVGIIHALECSFNFRGHLHNGNLLKERTRHVPSGRPAVWNPPSDWQASALDALESMKFRNQADWSLEMMLYRWERFNGFGYRTRNVVSPYSVVFLTSIRRESSQAIANGTKRLFLSSVGQRLCLRPL